MRNLSLSRQSVPKVGREQQHHAIPMPSTLKGVLKAPNGRGIAQHAHLLLALLVQIAAQSC